MACTAFLAVYKLTYLTLPPSTSNKQPSQPRTKSPNPKPLPPRTKPTPIERAGPASFKKKNKRKQKSIKQSEVENEIEIEIHNKFDSLSNDEEDHMDTSPCDKTNDQHSSSADESS